MQNRVILEREHLQELLQVLTDQGYQVMGPRQEGGAIVYGPVADADELPVGLVDEQAGGHYRLSRLPETDPQARSLFRYVVGPHAWKRHLFPPHQRLWRAVREADGFRVEADAAEPPRHAFFGVRACELAAIAVQDRVFDNGEFADHGYNARRERALLVAVDCNRPGGTCFCASMDTGPAARDGFDLCLTELLDAAGHRFLVRAASARGEAILAALPTRPAGDGELQAAARLRDRAAADMGRHMHPNAAAILARNPEHPRWLDVAERCLGCANCTLVCPTCFCSTVQDETALDGDEAWRTRQWDSCFSLDFSYIHGGPVRREAAARYRHWITHKLSTWHQQFGGSGCVGCGRCITWCPVGIDITEEVAAIRASETAHPGGSD
jgi:formate hydrogenlyase subunit 6/NADH:ubiquinone oxidoreductase subunit I